MMSIIIIAAAALAAGQLLGRLRPRQHLGDQAADQARFTEAWVRGGDVALFARCEALV
ncbi:hypothetical protein JQK87_17410 [Streptomyces sp. G44]|uniref:hypothetical protein n=1 Tax=Streptomyces sp. G44 TaxID=2807632 RepID=UPI001961CE22|nr:hypothetical protein [Streptomyces sp. G44]MBM7170146.1 hypothetical protein [Streptomyces sp. G44]